MLIKVRLRHLRFPCGVRLLTWAVAVVEQNRLLSGMIKYVQAADRSTGQAVCNEHTCPTMSAGPYVDCDFSHPRHRSLTLNNSTTYTWIDTNRNPIHLPAATYMKHIQTWVNGKITDPGLFPTDSFVSAPALPRDEAGSGDSDSWLGKSSGFPQRFENELKNMYKQMFRCYAHLYWQHWLIFWDLNSHRELNTCFVHFVNVGRIYGLLHDRDMEPMMPLVELWVTMDILPRLITGSDTLGGEKGEKAVAASPAAAS